MKRMMFTNRLVTPPSVTVPSHPVTHRTTRTRTRTSPHLLLLMAAILGGAATSFIRDQSIPLSVAPWSSVERWDQSIVSAVEGAALGVLSQTVPTYPSCTHPLDTPFLSPSVYSSPNRARPTNRWFMNAILGQGDQPIVTYPYSVRLVSHTSGLREEVLSNQAAVASMTSTLNVAGEGLYMSLPQKETNEIQVIMPWRPDLLLTTPMTANKLGEESTAAVPVPPIQAHPIEIEQHQVIDDDFLSVRVEWRRKDGAGRMIFPIVRGSPFLTGIYSGLTPALYSGHAILSVNDVEVPPTDQECTNSLFRHHIVLNSGQTILAYLDRAACVKWDRNRILFYSTSTTPVEGDWVIRVAMLPPLTLPVLRNSIGILDTFRASIPLSGSVSFKREGNEGSHSTSIMRMAWKSVDITQNTISTSPEGALTIRSRASHLDAKGQVPCELLILALPHHTSLMMNHRDVALTYDSIKGPLTAQVGSVWQLKLHHLSSASGGLPSYYATTKPVTTAKQEWQDAIRAALKQDSKANISSYSTDAYTFGKEAARMARLTLIADELQETAIAHRLRQQLKAALEPWLQASNKDYLLYDSLWGGLVPKLGLADRNADFGAGFYNDHHFHYGYFIYAFATVVKEEHAWGQQWKDAILTFVRDIANPDALVLGEAGVNENLDAAISGESSSTSFTGPRDPFFTSIRHLDFYDGHSWANGMFASPNGRNQESSTEAINAYYSISLLGRAFQDDQLMFLGEVLTSIETTGTHHYWHMTSMKSAYSPPFSNNKCVGMVWSDKVVQQTWFAIGLAYVHGINILPITPVSEVVLGHKWVEEEYPVLEKSVPDASPKMDDVWLGFVHADLAVLDPATAWDRTMKLKQFDGGASLTNFLYWIATRPNNN